MGLFGKKAIDTGQVDQLRAELAALRDRFDASDRAKADLEATVDALNQRLIVTAPPPPPPASPLLASPPPASSPPPPAADPASLDTDHIAGDITDHLTDQVIEDIAAVNRHLAALDERLAAVDGRVTAVSTELANQVTELGNDIEPMQTAAERLAAEQARYQIAFRQDLAELAERIRRRGNP